MAQEINGNGETEGGVSKVTITVTGGTHTFNIYEQDPELVEVLGCIERLLQKVLEKLQGGQDMHTIEKPPVPLITRGFMERRP
jgi:hypothetical protein